MLEIVRSIDTAVKKVLTAFCAVLLLLMVAFTVYSVVMRYVFEDPPVWGDLLTVLSNIWLVFFALALTVRDKDHIALDLIYSRLPMKAAFMVQQFWALVIFALGIIMIVYGMDAVSHEWAVSTGRCGISHGKMAGWFSNQTTCLKNMPLPLCLYQDFL